MATKAFKESKGKYIVTGVTVIQTANGVQYSTDSGYVPRIAGNSVIIL
jgi:hypothetical protein